MAQEKNVMPVLSVNSGVIMVPVDDNGEIIGHIRFNPNDLDIVRRYDGIIDTLNTITLPDKPTTDELLELSDKIKGMFDTLLGYPVSEVLFSKCNPFTPTTNGDLYFENVMEGIKSLIEITMKQRLDKKRKKIQAATSKYHK